MRKEKKIRHPGGVNEQRKNFYGTHLQEDERKKNHAFTCLCVHVFIHTIFFVYKIFTTYTLLLNSLIHSLVVHSLAQLTQGCKRLKI